MSTKSLFILMCSALWYSSMAHAQVGPTAKFQLVDTPLIYQECDPARGPFRDVTPPECQPAIKVNPTIPTTLNEILQLNGQALQTGKGIQLLGDWESSGDLPLSYVPTYEYAYQCQVEVSDRVARVVNGQRVRVFAVSQVLLTNATTYLNASEMQWSTVIATDDYGQTSQVVNVPVPFSLEGVAVFVGLSEDIPAAGKIADDSVTLGAQSSLQFAEQFVTRSEYAKFNRSSTNLTVTAEIFSHTKDYSSGRYRRVFVQCVKVK